jgi:hypothetical protein
VVTEEQVLHASRELLLGAGAVTEGWTGHEAEVVDGLLQLTFTWRRLPYRFAVRLALEDLSEGPWTGLPARSAEEWVYELSGRLAEEFDTGGVAWLPRLERDGLVELLWEEPRIGALSVELGSVHYVSELTHQADWSVREDGLDPGSALKAVRLGDLLCLWGAYVNNSRGRPFVAQLVVGALWRRAAGGYKDPDV